MKKFTIALFLVATAGCQMADDAEFQTTQQAVSSNRIVCGGIAGIACPSGMTCHITAPYADATGYCIGAPDNAQGGPNALDCSAVRCMVDACPAGEELRVTPNTCCGECRPIPPGQVEETDGFCEAPSDCEGLVHVMCVGSWSCVDNTCDYQCDQM